MEADVFNRLDAIGELGKALLELWSLDRVIFRGWTMQDTYDMTGRFRCLLEYEIGKCHMQF